MNTLLHSVYLPHASSLKEAYEAFIDRYVDEFRRFDVDRVKSHRTCRIAWAMVQDAVTDGLLAEHADFHALMAMLSILIEAEYSLLDPTEEDLETPRQRLDPLRIRGFEECQERWLVALNLRQIMNWHRKGYRDYGRAIAEAKDYIHARFSVDDIEELDLSVQKPAQRGIWR